MFTALLLVALLSATTATEPLRERPSVEDAPLFARWLVSQGSWGVLATLNDTLPFGYVASYSDGGTGSPYFYLSSALDPAGQDATIDARACFTLSERAVNDCRGADPQSPACSKISLTGKLLMLPPDSDEAKMAGKALFDAHPQFAGFPKRTGTFAVFKLDIQRIFLVNKAAPPVFPSVEEYLRID